MNEKFLSNGYKRAFNLCVTTEGIDFPVSQSVVLSVLGSHFFQQSVQDEIERVATWVFLKSRIGDRKSRSWSSIVDFEYGTLVYLFSFEN